MTFGALHYARLLRAVFVLVFAMSTVAAARPNRPTPPTPPANLARMSDLRAIGITVYYPRYVPARFNLTSVESTEDQQGRFGARRGAVGKVHREYALTYCDRVARCFSVRSVWMVDETGCLGKLTRGPPGRSRYFGKLEVCANGSQPNTTYDWLDGNAVLMGGVPIADRAARALAILLFQGHRADRPRGGCNCRVIGSVALVARRGRPAQSAETSPSPLVKKSLGVPVALRDSWYRR
jgi:hypothetical protein